MVQAQVPPIRRAPKRSLRPGPVGQAPSRPHVFEQPADSRIEPALVTELDGQLRAGWKCAERFRQSFEIDAQVGRQLYQYRPELSAKPRRTLHEEANRFFGVLQAPDVG